MNKLALKIQWNNPSILSQEKVLNYSQIKLLNILTMTELSLFRHSVTSLTYSSPTAFSLTLSVWTKLASWISIPWKHIIEVPLHYLLFPLPGTLTLRNIISLLKCYLLSKVFPDHLKLFAFLTLLSTFLFYLWHCPNYHQFFFPTSNLELHIWAEVFTVLFIDIRCIP